MVAEKDGTPIFVKTLGKVSVGHRVRLGKVGIDDRDDVVEGVDSACSADTRRCRVLEKVRGKVEELNTWKLPEGVKIKTFYDRTALIHTTVETVTDILISGMVLVFVILFVFLGHLRAALIVALTIPMSLLFTFTMMVLIGQSANLISLGSIDFGIIVDATLIMVESIFFHLAMGRRPGPDGAAADRARGPAGGTADLLLDGDHRGGVHSALYDDRRAGEDFCADVDHLWICLVRRAARWPLRWRRCSARFLLKGWSVRTIRGSCGRFAGPINGVLEWALDHRTVVVGACVGLLVADLRGAAVHRRGVHAGAGGGESLGSRHDARGYFFRPGGPVDRAKSGGCSGESPEVVDDCVTAWSSGRRDRSHEFFQCRVSGQSEAAEGVAARA